MFKKFMLTVCVLSVFFLQACESLEISMIKEASVDYDPSLTWGQAFDSYQYAIDPVWEVFETDRGQKFVRFTAKYDHKAMVTSLSEQFKNTFVSVMEGEPFFLVADFSIAADEKSFRVEYLGLEFQGETKTRSESDIEKDLIAIFENKPVKEDVSETARYVILNGLSKSLLNFIPLDTPLGASFAHCGKINREEYPQKAPSFNYIISLADNVDLGDTASVNLKFQVTDMTTKTRPPAPFEQLQKITDKPYKVFLEKDSVYYLEPIKPSYDAFLWWTVLKFKNSEGNRYIIRFEFIDGEAAIKEAYPLDDVIENKELCDSLSNAL